MITLELEIDYPDEAIAAAVMAALDPDNAEYVESELQRSKLLFRTKAKSVGTMRNTTDDLMACIKIAEKAIGMASRSVETTSNCPG